MNIEPLGPASLESIIQSEGGNGWKNHRTVWEGILLEQDQGNRVVLVASLGDRVVAYGSLLWWSAHPPFASAGIPEIHDLVTARPFRGQGIAKRLIGELERTAAANGHGLIGLGVGLCVDYGPAQRLYASLGYLPEGRGVTYRHQLVDPGSSVPVDDDLVLWLTKRLASVDPESGGRSERLVRHGFELLDPTPDDVAATISSGISRSTPAVHRENFAIVHRLGDRLIGGVTASVSFSILFIKNLWVADDHRGRGVGRVLMQAVENEGRRRGAETACLDTLSVQVPAFYEKLGYQEFGRLTGQSNGQPIDRIWYRKRL